MILKPINGQLEASSPVLELSATQGQVNGQEHDSALVEPLSGDTIIGTPLAEGFYNGSVGFRLEELGELRAGTQQGFSQAGLESCINPCIHWNPEALLGLIGDCRG
jgi:hypothetical protein